jgi:hypothetical protein
MGVNYRIALRGDVKCPDCINGHAPTYRRGRWRCNGPFCGRAVGKKTTCDKAKASPFSAKEE